MIWFRIRVAGAYSTDSRRILLVHQHQAARQALSSCAHRTRWSLSLGLPTARPGGREGPRQSEADAAPAFPLTRRLMRVIVGENARHLRGKRASSSGKTRVIFGENLRRRSLWRTEWRFGTDPANARARLDLGTGA